MDMSMHMSAHRSHCSTWPATVAAGTAMLDWYETAQHRPTPEAPRPYNAEEARRVLELISRLGLTKAQAAREASAGQDPVYQWLRGANTTHPSTVAAGTAMLDWYEEAQHRPTPEAEAAEGPRPYDAEEAKRVLELISRLGLTKRQAAWEASAGHAAVCQWLQGANTTYPSTVAAGAAMLDWYEEAQHRPSPEAEAAEGPRPYDATEAKKVLELIKRLGLARVQAAREARAEKSAANHWLRGSNRTSRVTLAAGAAMLDWYEVAQHRAPMPAHDLAKHDVVSDEDSEGADTMAGEPSESELSTKDVRAPSEPACMLDPCERASCTGAEPRCDEMHRRAALGAGGPGDSRVDRKRDAAALGDLGASKRQRVVC